MSMIKNMKELLALKGCRKKMPEESCGEKGFTLIEIMISLAIVSILGAGFLINGFNSMDKARISATKTLQGDLKTAAVGSVLKSKVMPATIAAMITDGTLEGDPTTDPAIGTSATWAVVAGNTAGEAGVGNGFDLSSNGTPDTLSTHRVAQLTLAGVTPEDALALKKSIDGATGSPALNAASIKGMVEYSAIAAGATGDVVLFITLK